MVTNHGKNVYVNDVEKRSKEPMKKPEPIPVKNHLTEADKSHMTQSNIEKYEAIKAKQLEEYGEYLSS